MKQTASKRPDQLLVTTQGVRGGKLHTNQQGQVSVRVNKGYSFPEDSITVDVFKGLGHTYERAETANINISFADGTQWNGNFAALQNKLFKPAPVKNPLCTRHAELKAKLLEITEKLLTDYENDIESGIEESIYEETENIETRQFIAEAKEVLNDFKNDVIEVLVFVEGGNIQGASATHPLEFTVFDKDNFDSDSERFTEIFGTPEQWNKLIKDRTEANDITPVF